MVSVLGAPVGGDAAGWDHCARQAREIFQGIVYGCENLAMTAEGGGLVHWVRADLTAPGTMLYVTPLDLEAVAQGWQYRLRRIADVIDSEHLAVAINACMFDSNFGWRPRWWPRLSGDLANSVETVVANHTVAPGPFNTSLLWFDDELTPHMLSARPLAATGLGQAKWAISGGEVRLHDGVVWPGSGRTPEARTVVAVNAQRKLLFLAVGGWISPRRVFELLANLGAKDGMLLDGGGSSAMAIGQGAAGVRAGTVFGGWRPVATYFGIKAEPVGTAQTVLLFHRHLIVKTFVNNPRALASLHP
jgi:hypothetical protein